MMKLMWNVIVLMLAVLFSLYDALTFCPKTTDFKCFNLLCKILKHGLEFCEDFETFGNFSLFELLSWQVNLLFMLTQFNCFSLVSAGSGYIV